MTDSVSPSHWHRVPGCRVTSLNVNVLFSDFFIFARPHLVRAKQLLQMDACQKIIKFVDVLQLFFF